MSYLSIFLKCFLGAFGLVAGMMCSVLVVLKCLDLICWYFDKKKDKS